MTAESPGPLGQRICITGLSGSGKSTLGATIASLFDVPYIEPDALSWLPNWVSLTETNPAEFERRLREATAGDAWVFGGSYSRFSEPIFWHRLDTVVWLDLPLYVIITRILRRSWRRHRSRELLWGTNYERFWGQLKIWDRESLIWWALTRYRRKRRTMLSHMTDPRWAHIRFIRLTSQHEIDAFVRALAHAAGPAALTTSPSG